MVIVAPSILSADFSKLGEEIKAVERAGAEWIHIDVMDGHFVPNLTMGPHIVSCVRKITNLFLDVHLMVENPEKFVKSFSRSGADGITFHIEACEDPLKVIEVIREHGCKVGISINPPTPVDSIVEFIDKVDLVLIMSVNPGFSGQSFIPDVLKKVKLVREKLDRLPRKVLLQVDGGINKETGKLTREAGADVLVSGSFIFGSEDYGKAIRDLLGR